MQALPLVSISRESAPSLERTRLPFKPQTIIASEPIELKLARNGGVPYEAKLIRFRPSGDQLNQAHYLQIVFKDVDRRQFARLKQTYGGWSATESATSFESLAGGKAAIKEVPIEAFLPPMMQLVCGKSVRGEMTNCWSTIYEMIRQAQKKASAYDVFLSWKLLKHLMTDDSFSEVVKEMTVAELKTLPIEERYRGVRSGDVMLIFTRCDGLKADEPSLLAHSVGFLDRDLFFEKPSWDGLRPFRLNHLAGLLPGFSQRNLVQFRRFKPTNPLPRIEELAAAWPKLAEIAAHEGESLQQVLSSVITVDTSAGPG
jgi:hypothetical protein